jgi:hypothetical protein
VIFFLLASAAQLEKVIVDFGFIWSRLIYISVCMMWLHDRNCTGCCLSDILAEAKQSPFRLLTDPIAHPSITRKARHARIKWFHFFFFSLLSLASCMAKEKEEAEDGKKNIMLMMFYYIFSINIISLQNEK